MKIEVKGTIIPNSNQWIYDLFDVEATSPKKVRDKIEKAKGEQLEVEINSPGGAVFAGSEIFTALRDYKNKVTVKIVGLAASAASVVAMSGDTTLMSVTGQMMIHNASISASGNRRDMEHTRDMLQNVDQTIANAYRHKSGLGNEELLDMMDKETWLTPEQAKDKGLIDGIMFQSDKGTKNQLEQLKLKGKLNDLERYKGPPVIEMVAEGLRTERGPFYNTQVARNPV